METNNSGTEFVNLATNRASFLGPPMILVGNSLSSSDPRWLAFVAFAEALGLPYDRPPLPLVGLDLFDPDVVFVSRGAEFASKFYEPSEIRPRPWSDGSSVTTPELLLGPIFAAPDPEADDFAAEVLPFAWELSRGYGRLTAQNLYGIGLMATGAGDPEVRTTPPVYLVPAGTAATRTRTLLEVWKNGGPVAVSAYEALATAEASRPGISRRVHPALVPYVQLLNP